MQDDDATPGSPILLGSDSIKGSNTPGWLVVLGVPALPAGALLLLALLLSALWIARIRRRAGASA